MCGWFAQSPLRKWLYFVLFAYSKGQLGAKVICSPSVLVDPVHERGDYDASLVDDSGLGVSMVSAKSPDDLDNVVLKYTHSQTSIPQDEQQTPPFAEHDLRKPCPLPSPSPRSVDEKPQPSILEENIHAHEEENLTVPFATPSPPPTSNTSPSTSVAVEMSRHTPVVVDFAEDDPEEPECPPCEPGPSLIWGIVPYEELPRNHSDGDILRWIARHPGNERARKRYSIFN